MNALATLDVVLFQAAGRLMALPASQVRACRAGKGLEPSVPLIETLLATAMPETPYSMLLEVVTRKNAFSCLVGAPVTLHTVPAHDIHPLPPLLAARLSLVGPRALIVLPEDHSHPEPILLIDAERFGMTSA
ncbi:MAG: hypothetical protein H7834_01900 [Magnetococcus sp. YQC-9]